MNIGCKAYSDTVLPACLINVMLNSKTTGKSKLMIKIQQALVDEYGFSDKRIKKVESAKTFVVDDRGSSDLNAKKNPFSWFCHIFVRVGSGVSVTLAGGVPLNDEIRGWASHKGHTLHEDEDGLRLNLSLDINESNHNDLIQLASLIENITAPGNNYSVPAYKYVCPRTAASLKRLAAKLSEVWTVSTSSTAS